MPSGCPGGCPGDAQRMATALNVRGDAFPFVCKRQSDGLCSPQKIGSVGMPREIASRRREVVAGRSETKCRRRGIGAGGGVGVASSVGT